jgi:hypothetical protein
MSKTQNRLSLSVLVLGLALAVVLLALALAPGIAVAEPDAVAASDHLVKNITLTPGNPNFVRLGQDVTVDFDYQTVEPGGVRIFARPFSGGAPSPGYLAGGSPVYPSGSGSGSNSFTINAGTAVVDAIRLQMLNADQSTLLFEAFIPVHYEFTDADDPVYDLEFDPATPNVLRHGDQVDVKFKYITDEPGGVRIFVRPFAGGDLAPGYSAHGSPIYPAGSGSSAGFFQIGSGDVTVDQVRVRMTNADQTLLLFEGFLPVHYQYGEGTNRVYNLALTPLTPNILDLNEDVSLTFDYATNQLGGVRIFARPMKGDDLAPGYSAHGSEVYPTGGGSGSGFFTINVDPLVVDGIRLRMVNADQTLLLYETVVPVHYQFGVVPTGLLNYLPVIFAADGE